MKKLFSVLVLCPIYVMAAPVNINQADAEAISGALTGIGPKKAAAIIQYREQHGSFKTVNDLENVEGIGQKTILANEKDILLSEENVPAEKPKDSSAVK